MHLEAVPFDTLKLARRLETAGLTGHVSVGVVEELLESLSTPALAAKPDVATPEAAVRGKIAALSANATASEVALRTEIQTSEAATRYRPPHP